MLRLVNDDAAGTPHVSTGTDTRRRPGRTAEAPAPPARTDPRWAFAVLIASRLEGGRAAVLRPEARERLVVAGKRLGIRPFDAALTIAMVQDAARRGEAPGQPGATTRALAERLQSLPEPDLAPPQAPGLLSMAASALFLGTALLGLAIMWVQMNP
jgi:hypothetical protein